MRFIVGFFSLEWLRVFDFIAPLLIRLWLAPIFWVSGSQRLGLFSAESFIWYNPLTWVNSDVLRDSALQLNLPLPEGLGAEGVTLAIGLIEVAGAVLLILGLAVRWIVLGLLAVVLLWLFLSLDGASLTEQAQQLVMQHGFITMEQSRPEVYVTYLILLITLFFMGSGRWFSLDWFIYRRFMYSIEEREARQYAAIDPFEINATDEPGIAPRK